MSKEDRSIRLLKKKIKANVNANEWYAASMGYKTLISRLGGSGKIEEALKVAKSAISALFEAGEEGAAMDLVDDLKVFIQKNSEVIQDIPGLIAEELAEILVKAPVEAENSALGYYQVLLSGFPGEKYPVLFEMCNWRLAQINSRLDDHKTAQDHYIFSNKPKEFASFLCIWADLAPVAERDLFLARGILSLLGFGGRSFKAEKEENSEVLEEAVVVIEEFINHYRLFSVSDVESSEVESEYVMTPLMNFMDYLLTALDKGSKDLFAVLRTQYKTSVMRDDGFEKLLNKIGFRFFDIPIPEDTGLSQLVGNLLPNLMQMMNASSESHTE